MITLAASLFDLSGSFRAAEIGGALFLVAAALFGSLAIFWHVRDRRG